jgi:hypothetical protein
LLAEDAERIGQDAFGQGGLVQAGQVESAWVRGCLHECETQHGSTCQPRSTEPIRGFLVVDAEKMRIVGVPQLCRSLALRYCWGSARAFRLEKANFEMLQREGSLKTALDKLPRTIKDALQLYHDLGERYLWVDSVCIYSHRTAMKHRRNLRFMLQISDEFNFASEQKNLCSALSR